MEVAGEMGQCPTGMRGEQVQDGHRRCCARERGGNGGRRMKSLKMRAQVFCGLNSEQREGG